jgi:hypothetical protein
MMENLQMANSTDRVRQCKYLAFAPFVLITDFDCIFNLPGKQVFSDGTYDGEWKEGKRCGKGAIVNQSRRVLKHPFELSDFGRNSGSYTSFYSAKLKIFVILPCEFVAALCF